MIYLKKIKLNNFAVFSTIQILTIFMVQYETANHNNITGFFFLSLTWDIFSGYGFRNLHAFLLFGLPVKKIWNLKLFLLRIQLLRSDLLEALNSYWEKSAYVAPEDEVLEQKLSRNASAGAKGMTLVFQGEVQSQTQNDWSMVIRGWHFFFLPEE